MLIALDYDDTYTRDPVLWMLFIGFAKGRGHTVICVTMRTPQEVALIDDDLLTVIEIIPTSRQAKKDYLNQRSVFPDIWIDDTPEFILCDARGAGAMQEGENKNEHD